MPKLSDLAKPPQRILEQMQPITPRISPVFPPPVLNDPFTPNPFLRCVLPAVSMVNPDNLRQFYRSGTAQTRNNPA